MGYREIDMKNDPRQAQFTYFSSLANPYVGVTVPVDVTAVWERCKETGESFFLCVLYAVVRAANTVPQLRRRIRADGAVVEFDVCPSSHIEPLTEDAYCYCVLHCQEPFEDFLPYAKEKQAQARQKATMEEDSLDQLFLSCVPWFSFTALVQPTPVPADSNPRLTWGRCEKREGRMELPLSILAHHALVDGVHIARFYQAVNEELRALAARPCFGEQP